jgi:chromosome segregation ATPase
MSIAVRVSVWVLGVLVIISAAIAVLTLKQKQSLEVQNQSLHNQITDDASRLTDLTTKTTDLTTKTTDLTTKIKKLEDDATQLNNKISQSEQEKTQAQGLYDELKHKSDELQAQLDQANTDRDDWKNRVGTISRERNELMQKLKNPPVKIVYKDRIVRVPVVAAPAPAVPQGDQYWASVLKQKAALQIVIEKAKSELDQAALQVVDLKKQNSDLAVEVKRVTNEKNEIIQKIKYGQDLADNLSVDLARSRNDQKLVNERADKLKAENSALLSQIRDLSSAKLELERSVARLTDDKDAMQKKLIETESIIQGRIDDIWKIKEGLDKKLSENAPSPSSGSMELPPIIVNAPNNQQQEARATSAGGRNNGSIISINESNNFVIVDLGQENSPVGVGNVLKVYRDSKQIAALEVIQVRRDICAADIKDKSRELKVGDIVKFN